MAEETPNSPPPPPPPPQLAYERPSGVTRGGFRLLLLLTFINTLLLGINLMGPQSWQAVRGAYTDWKDRRAQAAAKVQREATQLAAMRAASTYRFPENHVAYTEVVDEAMALVSQGLPYYSLSTSGQTPPPRWQAPAISKPPASLAGADKVFRLSGVAFLHERTAPERGQTLVVVDCDPAFEFREENVGENNVLTTTYHLSKRRTVRAATIKRDEKGELVRVIESELELVLPDRGPTRVASTTRPVHRSRPIPADDEVAVAPGNQFRLLGGGPDPADPSHFTIPYELDGERGVIDGWLKPEGVMLRPRQGRPAPSATDPAWELLPATRPTTAPHPQAQLLTIQEQCLAHTVPAGTVAYTEDPAVAAGLAGLRERYANVSSRPGSPQDWAAPIALREPPVWTALRELSASYPVGYETAKPYPMLFLHERTTRSGQPRVVVAQWVAEAQYGAEISRLLATRMHAPASRGGPATLIDHVQVNVRLPAPDATGGGFSGQGAAERPRGEALTLFAGQPDPKDESHFTIPYAIGENAGVIDGWVTDDKLILKPRPGDVTVAQGQQTWVLGAAAMPADASTRPAPAPGADR